MFGNNQICEKRKKYYKNVSYLVAQQTNVQMNNLIVQSVVYLRRSQKNLHNKIQ